MGQLDEMEKDNAEFFILTGTVLLLVALVLTFSRTGILVLVFEAFLFWGIQKKIHWKSLSVFMGIFLVILVFSGILSRFSMDRAVTNRPAIWLAGISLFAENPFGVGGGNSGLLASAFLLPDGIVCRTMVNSHLTLLTEYGILPAFFWFGILLYALFCGYKYPAFWTSLAGLAVSASVSSVFDWEILFDFPGSENLSLSNFIFSWLTFLFYLFLLVFLSICGKFQRKQALGSCMIAGTVLFVLFLAGSGDGRTPKLQNGMIVKYGNEMPLAFYDDSWQLKDVLTFFQDGYCVPVRSSEHCSRLQEQNAKTVFLFGKCAAFGDVCADRKIVFVSPPDYVAFPENLVKIYLKRFAEENTMSLAEEKKIETGFY